MDKLNDGIGEGTGSKDFIDAHFLHGGDIFRRESPPGDQQDIVESVFLHLADDFWRKNKMLSGKKTDPDDIHIFIDGGLDDAFR